MTRKIPQKRRDDTLLLVALLERSGLGFPLERLDSTLSFINELHRLKVERDRLVDSEGDDPQEILLQKGPRFASYYEFKVQETTNEIKKLVGFLNQDPNQWELIEIGIYKGVYTELAKSIRDGLIDRIRNSREEITLPLRSLPALTQPGGTREREMINLTLAWMKYQYFAREFSRLSIDAKAPRGVFWKSRYTILDSYPEIVREIVSAEPEGDWTRHRMLAWEGYRIKGKETEKRTRFMDSLRAQYKRAVNG